MKIWIIEDEINQQEDARKRVKDICKDAIIKTTREFIWPPSFLHLDSHNEIKMEDFPDIVILDIYKDFYENAHGSTLIGDIVSWNVLI